MSNSKNDTAWQSIFNKYMIAEKVKNDGFFEITARQINEFREARLMTKFDHKSQLPSLFSEHKLSILPTSRGGYVIGSFEIFHSFNDDEVEFTPIEFPTFLESLNHKDITSESTAINCSFVTKILHDFTGEENLLPTVSGRMSSSAFKFEINSLMGSFTINVENSQIEIDGGYEGDNSLSLIEAKNYISEDFLVRQLYYPYKLWNSKVTKRVRPIFLTYSNGVFHLREYSFSDLNHYNSLHLIHQKKYIIREGSFNIEVLAELLDNTKTIDEPNTPFPQADSFERVVNLCELISQRGFIAKEEITENYDFDARQTDYYSNAGKYLGLIDYGKDPITGQVGCYLTQLGENIFTLNLFERQKAYIRQIISHLAFKHTLERYLDVGEMPKKEEIVEIMYRSGIYNINSEITYNRRASTIAGWVNWIIAQLEE